VKEAIAALIGKHVVARRTERGKTQQEIAELVGISRQALSMIERGAQAPRWDTLYRIAEALRCDAFDLIPSLKQVRGL
jgi:transcriptional regulator with XRE-family HTH domain